MHVVIQTAYEAAVAIEVRRHGVITQFDHDKQRQPDRAGDLFIWFIYN